MSLGNASLGMSEKLGNSRVAVPEVTCNACVGPAQVMRSRVSQPGGIK